MPARRFFGGPVRLPSGGFIRHLFYPPYLWRTGTVLGKSGCCEEKCKPIIICDKDKALHFIFTGTLTD